MTLHPVLLHAAEGRLPEWAEAGPVRREHVARVADLLGEWAGQMSLPDAERLRWRAAGVLHDALRDADPETLRDRVPPGLNRLPGPVLHGPAAAERLRVEGVLDGAFLTAVSFHTVGSERLDRMGRALYCADFLEPGRDFLNDWRAELRARVATDVNGVTTEIVAARLKHLIDRGLPFLPNTVKFWNALKAGR